VEFFFHCSSPPESAAVKAKIRQGVLHKNPSTNSSTGLTFFLPPTVLEGFKQGEVW